MSVDEALDVHARVIDLVQDGKLQEAIDVLDDVVARTAHEPPLHLEMRIELDTMLYTADEFTRAATILDAVLPKLDGRDDAALLRYHAGVSHAEIGNVEPAIGYMTAFLTDADPHDPLYVDATFRLGVMLPAVGRVEDGLRFLDDLRPILAAEYGPDSIHVSSLDRRIAQIRKNHE